MSTIEAIKLEIKGQEQNTYAIHYFSGSWHSPLTKALSLFFTNAVVYKIAGIKERITKCFH